jgi:hypothetical protein
MDFADAALVRAAEREGLRGIFTVDRRDFAVYRLHGRSPFTTIPWTSGCLLMRAGAEDSAPSSHRPNCALLEPGKVIRIDAPNQ